MLSRHRDEGVTITVGGERIHVVLVDLRGDKARIGLEAGPDVTIHRDEIQAQVDHEDRQARRNAGKEGR